LWQKSEKMKRIAAILLVLCVSMSLMAQEKFCIAKDGKAATIIVDENDWKGVIRAARDLGDDIRKVTGVKSSLEFRVESGEFATALDDCAEGTAVANSPLSTLHSKL
jgi:hypothetical protein